MLYQIEIALFVGELLLVWVLFSELTALLDGLHVDFDFVSR